MNWGKVILEAMERWDEERKSPWCEQRPLQRREVLRLKAEKHKPPRCGKCGFYHSTGNHEQRVRG
jgi:hypothetical protein